MESNQNLALFDIPVADTQRNLSSSCTLHKNK